jgi:hypothetical protein
MNELLVVFIGLALVLYIFFVLGTARLSIQKGLNGIVWTLLALVLAPFTFFIVLFNKNEKREITEGNFFDNIVMELTQPFVDLASTSQAMFGLNFSYLLEGLTYFGVVRLLAIFFNQIELNDIDAGRMVSFSGKE